MLMVMYMKGNGRMIRLMDLGNICTQMGLSTKVLGKKINSMVLEKKPGQTVLVIKANITKVRKMVKVISSGQMVLPIKVSS